MAGDRRPAQPLEDADLNLVRTQSNQSVKAGAEALECLAWQPRDQIDMEMDTRVLAQPAKIGLGAVVVLAPADQACDLRIPGLDADLELQRAFRETDDDIAQPIGKMVWNQLEMGKAQVCRIGSMFLEKKIEDREAVVDTKIEGTVDEAEAPGAALIHELELMQEWLQGKRDGCAIQRR